MWNGKQQKTKLCVNRKYLQAARDISMLITLAVAITLRQQNNRIIIIITLIMLLLQMRGKF